MISILSLAADTVSSGNCFIVFKVLTLHVAMLTAFLHLSNFGLDLSSVADLSNIRARVPTPAECAPYLPMEKVM